MGENALSPLLRPPLETEPLIPYVLSKSVIFSINYEDNELSAKV